MNVGWVNDFSFEEMQGGCNISNKIMIEKGRELGHKIVFITPKNPLFKHAIETGKFEQESQIPGIFAPLFFKYDLLILSNINMFKTEIIEWIIKNKPYIKYEHDYCYCKNRNGCVNCNPKCVPAKIFIDLFSNSLLNIFFSNLQLDIYKERFGETMRDAIIIPAPIEKGKDNHPTNFYPDENLQQDAYLYAGMIATHKGVHQILDYADTQKKKIFHFAGPAINKELLERIKEKHVYLGEISHNEIPRLYRKYRYFLVNPQMPETFGITILEAILSGCTLVKFSKTHTTGLESYQLSPKDMMIKCLGAPNKFWKKISEVKRK